MGKIRETKSANHETIEHEVPPEPRIAGMQVKDPKFSEIAFNSK